jgi:hypothetical protein
VDTATTCVNPSRAFPASMLQAAGGLFVHRAGAVVARHAARGFRLTTMCCGVQCRRAWQGVSCCANSVSQHNCLLISTRVVIMLFGVVAQWVHMCLQTGWCSSLAQGSECAEEINRVLHGRLANAAGCHMHLSTDLPVWPASAV